MTHQDITERIKQMRDDYAKEHIAARAKIIAKFEKERESLQELCAGLGHVEEEMAFMNWSRPFCRVCDAWTAEAKEVHS